MDRKTCKSCPAVMGRSLMVLLASTSFVLALNVCVATALITGWGEWYSSSLAYRRQTEALLHGHLALSNSPSEIGFDMAWANGGVQQVWGLGVPFWRLPFEIVARLFGQAAFPDRLALLAAIAVVTYLLLRAFTVPNDVTNVSQWCKSVYASPHRLIAVLFLILCPSVLTLCRGRFNVYAEAVVYEYFYSIGLLAGLILFIQRPSVSSYAILSVASGITGFVRPTALVYGLASVAVAFVVASQRRWSLIHRASGPVLFTAGLLVLLWTNATRFGSAIEFGHRLNMTGQDMIYLSRFQSPFDTEPIVSASKELIGSMFFDKRLNDADHAYSQELILWQSDTARWRNFYATTFDWSSFWRCSQPGRLLL